MTLTPDEAAARALAEQFHATYELLAPQFGYETRAETRQFDPASSNGKLMIAVCASIIATSQAEPKTAVDDEYIALMTEVAQRPVEDPLAAVGEDVAERVARAIAANKRGLSPASPLINSKWQSYAGQARAAISAMSPSLDPATIERDALERAAKVADDYACLAKDIATTIRSLSSIQGEG